MKLKELKENLNEISPELDNCEVILQIDAEGNGCSPLHGIDKDCIYIPNTTWSGDIYRLLTTADDNCMSELEWEELKNDKTKRCIVLQPVN